MPASCRELYRHHVVLSRSVCGGSTAWPSAALVVGRLGRRGRPRRRRGKGSFLSSAHAYGFLMNSQNLLTSAGPDGYPDLGSAAFSNLTWALVDARFSRAGPLGKEVNAYVFEGGRESSVAASSGFRAAQLLFGTPVTVSPFTSAVSTLSSQRRRATVIS